VEEQRQFEQERGITHIVNSSTFDVEAQVIDLSKLDPDTMDPRLAPEDSHFLAHSNALILNIDYPLGYSAYHLLAKVAEHSGEILEFTSWERLPRSMECAAT